MTEQFLGRSAKNQLFVKKSVLLGCYIRSTSNFRTFHVIRYLMHGGNFTVGLLFSVSLVVENRFAQVIEFKKKLFFNVFTSKLAHPVKLILCG